MKRSLCLLAALTALTLVSCSKSRTAADAQLSEACLGGIKAMYGPNDTLEPKDTVFQSQKSTENTNLRVVRIHAVYTHDHGILQEKDYVCSFEETSGLFGYKAAFYSMDVDGNRYGNFGGTITGDLSDLMKINNTVEPLLR